MHFDNWTVSEETRMDGGNPDPDPEPDPEITFTPEIAFTRNGQPRLTWPASADETFLVEYSEDLVTWKADLANAQVTATAESGGRFRDTSTARTSARYYRVRLP